MEHRQELPTRDSHKKSARTQCISIKWHAAAELQISYNTGITKEQNQSTESFTGNIQALGGFRCQLGRVTAFVCKALIKGNTEY